MLYRVRHRASLLHHKSHAKFVIMQCKCEMSVLSILFCKNVGRGKFVLWAYITKQYMTICGIIIKSQYCDDVNYLLKKIKIRYFTYCYNKL